MTSELYTVTVDAADPHRLARFWSEFLGYKIVYDTDDEVAIEKSDELSLIHI